MRWITITPAGSEKMVVLNVAAIASLTPWNAGGTVITMTTGGVWCVDAFVEEVRRMCAGAVRE